MIDKPNALSQLRTIAPAKTRQRKSREPSWRRLTHELINQLSVLRIVGERIIDRQVAPGTTQPAGEREIFQRCLRESTLLAQNLVQALESQVADPDRTKREIGQVVRLLRKVPDRFA